MTRLIGGVFSLAFWLMTLGVFALALVTYWPNYQGGYAWELDLLSQFRLPFFWLLAFGFVMTLIFHRKGRAKAVKLTFLLLFVSVSAYPLLGLYWPPRFLSGKPPARDEQTVRMLFWNVYGLRNKDYNRAAALVRDEDPDIAGFAEFSEDWQQTMNRLGPLKGYPHRYNGIAHLSVYSRFPILGHQVLYSNPGQREINDASLRLTLSIQGRPVRLYILHPYSPITRARYLHQKEHFESIVNSTRSDAGSFIIAGDFNTCPWSHLYRSTFAAAGIKNTMDGFGVQASWPTTTPMPILAIDHILTSPDIRVQSRHVAPNGGSDHHAVVSDLQLP